MYHGQYTRREITNMPIDFSEVKAIGERHLVTITNARMTEPVCIKYTSRDAVCAACFHKELDDKLESMKVLAPWSIQSFGERL